MAHEKISDLLRDLGKAVGDPTARFHCLFLVDDFCGSGKTLLRELVVAPVEGACQVPTIPSTWKSRLSVNEEKNSLELFFQGELVEKDRRELLKMSDDANYAKAVDTLVAKSQRRETVLKGALEKVARDLETILEPEGTICFCPLLITEQALNRLKLLVPRLPGKFAQSRVLAGAVLGREVQITSPTHPAGALCEKYYSEEFEDEHTGSVKYGLENCGLPLVLHHNTPNNSLFLLWARKKQDFSPLFVRYERHGREGA